MPSNKNPRSRVCRFFSKHGDCRFGETCRFEHILGGVPSSPSRQGNKNEPGKKTESVESLQSSKSRQSDDDTKATNLFEASLNEDAAGSEAGTDANSAVDNQPQQSEDNTDKVINDSDDGNAPSQHYQEQGNGQHREGHGTDIQTADLGREHHGHAHPTHDVLPLTFPEHPPPLEDASVPKLEKVREWRMDTEVKHTHSQRQPGAAELNEYAVSIGMDPHSDKDLMWIAKEGLQAQLPREWVAKPDPSTDAVYYVNKSTGVSTWEHPCDRHYRELFKKERHKVKKLISQIESHTRSPMRDENGHDEHCRPRPSSNDTQSQSHNKGRRRGSSDRADGDTRPPWTSSTKTPERSRDPRAETSSVPALPASATSTPFSASPNRHPQEASNIMTRFLRRHRMKLAARAMHSQMEPSSPSDRPKFGTVYTAKTEARVKPWEADGDGRATASVNGKGSSTRKSGSPAQRTLFVPAAKRDASPVSARMNATSRHLSPSSNASPSVKTGGESPLVQIYKNMLAKDFEARTGEQF